MSVVRPIKRDVVSGQLAEVVSGDTLFGASGVSQVEIDFGALPVAESSFVIVDASVTPTSRIVGHVSYEAPTGKDLDEIEMDVLDLSFGPGSGQFTLYAKGTQGYVADKFKVNYIVG